VNFENRKMMTLFEKEVEKLTGRTTPMGVKEILLNRAKEEGIEEGAQIERAKALQEKIEMAKTFKNLGVATTDIAKGTGLCIEEIEDL
jgi:predicted transposase/invertase (TIGR01784 family)